MTRVFVLAAAGLAAVAVLTACATAPAPVKLPPRRSTAPSLALAAPADGTGSQQQAVVDAYTAFWPAANDAEKAGNAAAARTILAPYVYSGYIGYMVAEMRVPWAKHEVNWGADVEHIESVTVIRVRKGEEVAIVKDCQDASRDGLAIATTGELVPGTLGSAHQQLYASLSLIAGRWLIEQITFVGNACAG